MYGRLKKYSRKKANESIRDREQVVLSRSNIFIGELFKNTKNNDYTYVI